MAVTATRIAPAAALDVERVRRDFPILERSINGRPLVYLDSAASAQRPLPVLRAVERYETHSSRQRTPRRSCAEPGRYGGV